jgi:hypothetical protein
MFKRWVQRFRQRRRNRIHVYDPGPPVEPEPEPPTLPECSICFTPYTHQQKYITPCHHEFCIACVQRMVHTRPCHPTHPCTCPLCRQQFLYYTPTVPSRPKLPFDPANYPSNIELDLVTDPMTRRMLEDAYRTITQAQKWQVLYNYDPHQSQSFMMTQDPEILDIMHSVNENHNYHSGFSLALTMRNMHTIAHNGLDEYSTMHRPRNERSEPP